MPFLSFRISLEASCQVPKRPGTSLTEYLWLFPALLIPLPALNLSSPGAGLYFPFPSFWSYTNHFGNILSWPFGSWLAWPWPLCPLGSHLFLSCSAPPPRFSLELSRCIWLNSRFYNKTLILSHPLECSRLRFHLPVREAMQPPKRCRGETVYSTCKASLWRAVLHTVPRHRKLSFLVTL